MKNLFIIIALFAAWSCKAQKAVLKAGEPVRGTWVTNVASDALTSKEKISETIALCRKFGLNTIYVVTWNKGMTMYPSPVVKKYIGTAQDPVYNGFDPIAEIIRQGHMAGIRVIGWFEFGFAYDYKDSTSNWLKKYPHWAGRSKNGSLLQKNGFFWWNSLHPEVQQFMNELIMDFVTRYDADGVQGDDRLPAMPSEGGYDNYTVELYKSEHGSVAPPQNTKDPEWVQWRADKLSAYIKDLYGKIKRQKKNYIVSWAPSLYPWSKEQYLQDWPAWLNGGYADEILPQLYRYDLAAYEKVVEELDAQLTPAQKSRVFPGVLTGLGDGYQIDQSLLNEMIRINRKFGFAGECTFYFEALKRLQPFYKR